MDNKNKAMYTVGEEIFNAVSHGIGALLSAAAFALLVVCAALYGDGYSIASAIVFGTSLVVLYSMSAVYHIATNATAKYVLRVFDHCSIFLLIAGTYTPYLLVTIRSVLGWTMFGLIWAAALVGVVLNCISMERFRRTSLICYVCMGWAIVFAMKPIASAMESTGLVLLIAGGIVYTIGVIFYVMKKYKYMHSVWHLFVLAGSICHYFSILLYVLPNLKK
ncbi:MAG: hemolysin III family protein [Clostridia bacterium]|nr:hemolysin III family protein [Clostridia bacterium]